MWNTGVQGRKYYEEKEWFQAKRVRGDERVVFMSWNGAYNHSGEDAAGVTAKDSTSILLAGDCKRIHLQMKK